MMKYIIHRRFKGRADCGAVNLPYATEVSECGGWLYSGGKMLCAATSENAHQYFARNDDGAGLERGRLTQAIQKALRPRNGDRTEQRDKRWESVWGSPLCQKYRQAEHADHWLWGHDFYNAPIEDLRQIAALVGVRERS